MSTRAFLSAKTKRKIRTIQLKTVRMLRELLIGNHRSVQKGSGFTFNKLSHYVPGDDIRFIDWKASARAQQLLVKEYVTDIAKTIIIAIDVSQSRLYSTDHLLKTNIIAEIGTIIALAGMYSNDRVGLILYANDIEKYVPPRDDPLHMQAIIETIFEHTSTATGTNSAALFKKLLTLHKRNALVFVISDLIDDTMYATLPAVARMYDLIMVRILDQYEQKMPQGGFINAIDVENGALVSIDTNYATRLLTQRITYQNSRIKKAGAHLIDITNHCDVSRDIIHFFRQRMYY